MACVTSLLLYIRGVPISKPAWEKIKGRMIETGK
jgi:hypothetical protein